ncbi:MAG: dihydrolipoamide acetyltransferase family protein [Bacteroidota bacterium]
MAQVQLIMPKMGESIMEATITKWYKQVGDTVEMDESILEIQTDKVDSEVPSPASGTLLEILHPEDAIVAIGEVIAIIGTEGEEATTPSPALAEVPASANGKHESGTPQTEPVTSEAAVSVIGKQPKTSDSGRFYSPLVKNIAKQEEIPFSELDTIEGSGKNGRVTKKDLMAYLKNRKTVQTSAPAAQTATRTAVPAKSAPVSVGSASVSGEVEIVEMDRIRRVIADHMVRSKQTSPHVTSFVEVDVTNIVNWRNRVKQRFQEQYNEKITYTPIFIEAVVKALKDFPLVNVSVDGHNILVKKFINIGMATALPSGNLIVPVIKNADNMNLIGLARSVNDLASRARANQLKPEETQNGTFTVTNVGTFGNAMGTPIINQPQVAILATGTIKKKPAVIETEYGDVIAVRHLMFMSLSYDHRVVDGMMGGSFLRRIADYLEQFDADQSI